MIISSRQNDRVKSIRALRERKERDASGTFFAEGERILRAALQTGAVFQLVVLAPDRLTKSEAALVDALEEMKLPLLEVTPELFDVIALREEAQSVGAVISQRWEALSSVNETRTLLAGPARHPAPRQPRHADPHLRRCGRRRRHPHRPLDRPIPPDRGARLAGGDLQSAYRARLGDRRGALATALRLHRGRHVTGRRRRTTARPTTHRSPS